MKEKRKSKHRETSKSRRRSISSSSSEEWVEKKDIQQKSNVEREDWMSMTGMLKTYTKEDIKPKREKDKKHIDSYNPSTSVRELNPYWKDGGTGLPQTSESFRKSKPFVRPSQDDDDYYNKPRSSSGSKSFLKPSSNDDSYYKSRSGSSSSRKSSNYECNERDRGRDSYRSHKWKQESEHKEASRENKSRESPVHETSSTSERDRNKDSYRSNTWKQQSEQKETGTYNRSPVHESSSSLVKEVVQPEKSVSKYLSDEKMNKLAAKIVKAEIMGDLKLVTELKEKLEAARQYRKQNPDAGKEEEDDRVMLISTNASGNSRPLSMAEKGDPRSRSGKRKAETHVSGERQKYFGNDDKYDLAQMFQQEKYGNNDDNDAELAKIASKHKNPNDDLEDIFMDEISKNRNAAKDSEHEKQKAISQHKKIEKSLEGCEFCVDSKNMLKHMMVSCGSKVYVALPAKKSLVKDQCFITTIQHSTCVTSLDEDVWEEILNYRKALTKFYNSQNKDVVFFETATKLHRYPHMVINCVPLPRDVGDMAAIYFKKALLECEAEWSMNKKVVDLKGKNIRKGIPKGLPYFWIDFGMDPGFAHVIEDQQLFPKTFAEEIIAGILDLDHNLWKNPRKEYGDIQRKKVVEFIAEWKSFDPTKNSN